MQEYCQLYQLPLPIYETHKESGSAHQPRFRSMCQVKPRDELKKSDFEVWGDLCGTKKLAELSTAEKMLQEIASAESELKTNNPPHILETVPHGQDIYEFLDYTDPFLNYTDLVSKMVLMSQLYG